MKACVFDGNLAVLVKEFPTKEIIIKRGLKQGNPIDSFLFIPVSKGLGGLVVMALELGLYFGFRFWNFELVVSHLQYADGTLLMVDPSLEDLW